MRQFIDAVRLTEDVSMTLYHGTTQDFDTFEPSDGGAFGPGIYLSPDPHDAEKWATIKQRKTGGDIKVVKVITHFKNPYYWTDDDKHLHPDMISERVRAAGHDAIICKWMDGSMEVVAFDNSQLQRVDESSLKQYMKLIESQEEKLWQKGHDDGLTGQADFEFLNTVSNERPYWSGFDYAKSKKPLPKMPRIAVPSNLKGITRNDLNAAYSMLMAGHALDKVKDTPPRERDEAVEEINRALAELSHKFVNGTIILYRTIQDDDPTGWVKAKMTTSQHLGRFWSSNEEFVMQHANHERVLFCVEAHIAAVDWPETIVLTIDGVEEEIRLKDGADIKLSYVKPSPIKPEPNQFV